MRVIEIASLETLQEPTHRFTRPEAEAPNKREPSRPASGATYRVPLMGRARGATELSELEQQEVGSHHKRAGSVREGPITGGFGTRAFRARAA